MKRKTKVRTNLRPVGGRHIGELVQTAKDKPKEFAGIFEAAVEDEGLRFADIRDFRALYDKLAPLTVEVDEVSDDGSKRSIMTSAFPLAMGTLAIAAVMDAYEAETDVTPQLVTEIDDVKSVTHFEIIREHDTDADEVPEGKDFPEIGAAEDFVLVDSVRNGRRISITRESILQNNIVNFVERCNWLGRWFREWSSRLTLRRICDISGSGSSPAAPYVYRPKGVGTQLYNATANLPSTRSPSGTRLNNNALSDYTDLDNALIRLSTMRSDRNRPVRLNLANLTILVPFALLTTAWKILNSELQDSDMVKNFWGTQGYTKPQLIYTTELDAYSTAGGTTWYMGDFRKQFGRKWQYRMDYVQLGQETESYLRNRTAFQASVSGALEVFAKDHIHVVQNLAGTTAPAL